MAPVTGSLVVVSSGDSVASKTRALAAAAIELGATVGPVAGSQLIDLIDLPADALLGRRQDPAVEHAVAAASAASILVLATPVYRATFNGTLKAFLDRFPTDALARTAVVLVATAGSPTHYLSLDTGGRSVVASLGGWTVPTVVYATGGDFSDGHPSESIVATLRTALEQAVAVAGAIGAPAGAAAGE
jgi:FMN reductase